MPSNGSARSAIAALGALLGVAHREAEEAGVWVRYFRMTLALALVLIVLGAIAAQPAVVVLGVMLALLSAFKVRQHVKRAQSRSD